MKKIFVWVALCVFLLLYNQSIQAQTLQLAKDATSIIVTPLHPTSNSKYYWGYRVGPSMPSTRGLIPSKYESTAIVCGWLKEVCSVSPAFKLLLGFTGWKPRYPVEMSFSYLGKVTVFGDKGNIFSTGNSIGSEKQVFQFQTDGGQLSMDAFQVGLALRHTFEIEDSGIVPSILGGVGYYWALWDARDGYEQSFKTYNSGFSYTLGASFSYPLHEMADFVFEMNYTGGIVYKGTTCDNCVPSKQWNDYQPIGFYTILFGQNFKFE